MSSSHDVVLFLSSKTDDVKLPSAKKVFRAEKEIRLQPTSSPQTQNPATSSLGLSLFLFDPLRSNILIVPDR